MVKEANACLRVINKRRGFLLFNSPIHSTKSSLIHSTIHYQAVFNEMAHVGFFNCLRVHCNMYGRMIVQFLPFGDLNAHELVPLIVTI